MTNNGNHYRLMTYNIGGARTTHEHKVVEAISGIIKTLSPDIVGMQEVVGWQENQEPFRSLADDICRGMEEFQGNYYGPTLSFSRHFHPNKALFLDVIFHDYKEWSQGNAILSKWNFSRLSDPRIDGTPYNLPIFRPLQYEGNRNTDPRHAILTRIMDGQNNPYLICTHLTTLVKERKENDQIGYEDIAQNARAMRKAQITALLKIIQKHILQTNEIVLLMGDFNAYIQEDSLQELIKSGFVWLEPENYQPTHQHLNEPIDHIFMYPATKLADYHCQIINTELAKEASDHFPVVADIVIKD